MITIRDPKGSAAPESYQHRVEASGNLPKWGPDAIIPVLNRGCKTSAECRELPGPHRIAAGYKFCRGLEKSDFVHLARFPQSESGSVRNPEQSRFG
jgi:hypothetical protein